MIDSAMIDNGMIHFVALPLVVTLGVALAGSRRLDRLYPATAARCSAVLLAAVAIAAVPTLWLIGLSGLAHLGFHNPVFDWSQHLFPDDRPFGAIVGVASFIAAVVGTIRVGRVLTHHCRVRCTDTCPVEFIDSAEIFAYTLPGPARTIAVSDGLRNALDDSEFDVVMAHEQAHAAVLLAPTEQPALAVRMQTTMVVAATLALTAYQIHHSVMFATDLVR